MQPAESLRHLEFGEREPQNFREKLERLWKKGNFVCVGLDSDWSKIPGEFKNLGREEGTFQFNKENIDYTADLVCSYKPNIAFYEDSTEGETALERTVAYIHESYPYIPVIGDLKRGDIGNTNDGYVKAAFNRYNFDAVTVHPFLGAEALKPFLERADKGIIVLCRTSNPGAGEFQDLPIPIDKFVSSGQEIIELIQITGKMEIPLYLAVAYRVSRYWDKNRNCALVVGATYPAELERVRKVAPNMPILIPGVGTQGGEVQKTVVAGMDKKRSGMIINSSRGIIFASREEGETVGQAARREIQKLSETINYYRENPEGLTDSQKELAGALFNIGAIKFGAFRLKLHEKQPTAPLSPIYFDLRVLRSVPPETKLLTCKVYQDLMANLQFDLYADVPTAITPIVSLLSQVSGIPMVTPRVEKKGYGSGAQIDGIFQEGQTAVLIDDLITTAASKFEAIEVLEKNKITVKDVIVLVDREQGGAQELANKGYKLHAAFTISNLLRYYLRTGKIDHARYDEVTSYLTANR